MNRIKTDYFLSLKDWCNSTNRSESLLFFASSPTRDSLPNTPEASPSPSAYVITSLSEYFTSTRKPRQPKMTPRSFTIPSTAEITTHGTTFPFSTTTTTTTTTTTITPSTTTPTSTAFSSSILASVEPSIMVASAYPSLHDFNYSSDDSLASFSPFYAALIMANENQSECCFQKYKEYIHPNSTAQINLIQVRLN